MSKAKPPKLQAQKSSLIAAYAHGMRQNLTPSESLLWQAISAKKLGLAFRRQVPVGPFIADFLAPSIKLIIEVDGGYHAERVALDERRDSKLQRWGYRVLRFGDHEVVQNLEGCLAGIRETLAQAV